MSWWAWWVILGVVAIVALPTPKTRTGGALFILCCGPAAWASFVIFSIRLWWRGELVYLPRVPK